MGLGFILGGFCPGTSVCAAAIGKVDAMFFVGGGLIGVLVFGETYPLFKGFYASTALGPLKVFHSLGISQGLFGFLLIAAAIAAFVLTTRIERKVAGESAPSMGFPVLSHAAAGAAAMILGLILIFLPDYKTRLLNRVSAPGYQSSHLIQEMDADELAFRIVDQEPQTRILDLRPASAFATQSLPGSTNLAQKDLFNRDLGGNITQRRLKKVIIADTEREERMAYLLLQELGYENFTILKGGFKAFDAAYLNPVPFVPEGTRWDEDVRHFRETAQGQIQLLIAANKKAATKTPAKEKKIQGGC
jgi:rhodanese-related sulfurtransferase